MKSVILYAHPVENDGLSIQGDMLYRGMKENGEDARPCHWRGALQRDWLYRTFQPDIAIGIGFWGYTPDLILHPKQFGVTPVPWLVADGWVANYHNVLQELPLVFVTSTWVKEVYERDGVNTKNFVVAPVAVEPEVFKPIPKSDPRVQKLRELLGVKPEEKLLLTIGGDVTSKGAQEVLRALAQVNKEFKNWKYICKAWEDDGRREYSDEENALIEALKLPKERISFLSGSYSREFIPYLLNAADIYMAPSRIEGFGMIQLEAQATRWGRKIRLCMAKQGILQKLRTPLIWTASWCTPKWVSRKKCAFSLNAPKHSPIGPTLMTSLHTCSNCSPMMKSENKWANMPASTLPKISITVIYPPKLRR